MSDYDLRNLNRLVQPRIVVRGDVTEYQRGYRRGWLDAVGNELLAIRRRDARLRAWTRWTLLALLAAGLLWQGMGR